MSMNRVSYLESWAQNLAAFHHQYQDQSSITDSNDDDEDDDLYQDLPESSVSSSYRSTYSYHLSFNPYAGPGWIQAPVEHADDDQASHPGPPSINLDQTQLDKAEREGSTPESIAMKLEEDRSILRTTGAFEVDRTKRILQVSIAVTYCFLAAGVVFGFAALKPILIQEGVYRNRCPRGDIPEGQNVCYEQELRLNLMFTIAAVTTNISALPVGTILDTYGPRVCGIIGSICLALGSLSFALASKLPFDTYMPGFLLLSLGGPFIFISSFHLSNSFPRRSGLILSILTGAFDGSSAVFLILRLINEKTAGWFTTERFFLAYLIVPLFIFAAQLVIMPETSYKTAGELVQLAAAHITDEENDKVDDHIRDRSEGERQRNDRRVHRQSIVNKIHDLLDDKNDNASVFGTNSLESGDGTASQPHQIHNQPAPGGVWGALHGYPALQQIRSPWFILITFFTILQMLRINYFITSIREQYEYLLSSLELAQHLNNIFDFFLPLGGLLSVPFIGIFLDNTSTPLVLLFLFTSSTIISIIGCIPHSIIAGYANISLFVIYRPLYYTAVSDYAAKVFGFQTFGKVYGLIIFLAGLGNFGQAGLDAITFVAFHGNPIPVNIILTLLTVVSGPVLVGFVWWKARDMALVSRDRFDLSTGLESSGIATRNWEEGEREPLLQREPLHGSTSYGMSSTQYR